MTPRSWILMKAFGLYDRFSEVMSFSKLPLLHQLRRHRSRRLILSATGETSPRLAGAQGDCQRRRKDIVTTAGDVAETLLQLRRRLGDVAATARDVAKTSPQLPGELVMFDFDFFFFFFFFFFFKIEFSSLRQVSEMFPRRLHQLRQRQTRRLILSVTAWRSRRLWDLLETKEIDCQRHRENVAVTAGDVAETLPQLRRHLGDVAATARVVAKTSPLRSSEDQWREMWVSEKGPIDHGSFRSRVW